MDPTEDPEPTNDLIVAANRGPVNIHRDASGNLVAGHGAGGLAPSLARALEGRGALWIAAAQSEAERDLARGHVLGTSAAVVRLDYIDLSPQVVDAAYNVIANRTLWYLHHGMFDRVRQPRFDHAWWEAWGLFRAYNVAFAERLASRAAPRATVIVNDYHLSLVGTTLSMLRPDCNTVHFTHTPFATPEEFSILPDSVAEELLDGLSRNGAVGFHSARWRDRFLTCLEYRSMKPANAFVAPLGSDATELEALRNSASVRDARDELRVRHTGKRTIVRSDRIEPSKNILRGIAAFAELLELHPRLVGNVRFVMRVYASRTSVEDYVRYADEMRQLVDEVNSRYFEAAGENVIELDTGDDFDASVAALSIADVIFVNPIRDGMNLVAKEGPIVNERDAVLVLSNEAGAHEELAGGCISIDPFDVSATAAALLQALELPPEDRAERASELRRVASALPPFAWLDAVMGQARALT